MTPFCDSSSRLTCEIKVVRLRNFELLSGNLFVRYYVYAGDGRLIRVDTSEAPATCRNNPYWDHELASLECRAGGVSGPVRELLEPRGKGVTFELRWRPKKASASSLLGGLMARSKLLARSEVVPWEDVLAASSAGKPLERWIPLAAKAGAGLGGLKLPSLLVEMNVKVATPGERRWTQRRALAVEKECGCRDCEWAASEEDMFQAAALCSAW